MIDRTEERSGTDQNTFTVVPPSLTLPKGGGAVRGLGEKFTASPVTGTGSMKVPIATSPGRSGFGPELSLTYDSGSGTGPFGMGWSLSLPVIARKTDTGLPRYDDDAESDVFILSGAEDLVPRLERDAQGNWVSLVVPPRVVNGVLYRIRAYRPRIEGLFARIERWTSEADSSNMFWRTISPENVTTWYGLDTRSRIADPADPRRIFSWLISETHDAKGNVVVYRYKPEDSVGVDRSQAHERNRAARSRAANRYIKSIRYGNHKPYLPKLSPAKPWPLPPGADAADGSIDWFFEVVFDYGEHDRDAPTPGDPGAWLARSDPLSIYRAGFEVRTYRLCRRVLMFHHFPGESGVGADCVVRSTDFSYSADEIHSILRSVSQLGYKRQSTGYLKRSLPPVEFEYTRPIIDDAIHELDAASTENLPYGLDGTHYQWTDLDGEGLSGLLTEQGGAWFYKRNFSALPLPANGVSPATPPSPARFGPLERVGAVPNGAAVHQFMDLGGNGRLDVVELETSAPGFFERESEESWENFTPFESVPNLAWQDPNLKFVDLTGDGHPDILITEDEVFNWYPGLGRKGFGPAEPRRQATDEEAGPRLVFADRSGSIYLSDLSGDGLIDLVRIRNGEVCYWPNLGYGRFGAKITMDNAPWFDSPDQFDQRRIRLADIDGSGAVDIMYLGRDGVDLYFNRAGNGWSAPRKLKNFPSIDELSSVAAVDLLGNGTACLVWSSPLPGDARRSLRYLDLMGGSKPHLLTRTVNNLGGDTRIEYAPSTRFYLADKLAGTPWITKLPFPVHVVHRVVTRDHWRKTEFASTYSYHHGYFDGVEREFRGFGRVDQIDVETFDKFAAGNSSSPYITDDQTLYQPPVKTVTWFHTGAAIDRTKILSQFRDEYFPRWFEALSPGQQNVLGPFRENELPDPDFESEPDSEEWREGLRACKGMVLRQEIYQLDVDPLHSRGEQVPVRLFSSEYHNCHIQMLQPRGDNRHAVYLVTESEVLTYNYELDLGGNQLRPDPRIAHTLNLNTDEFGNVQQAIAVVYPRSGQHQDAALNPSQLARIRSVQQETHVGYTETHFTNDLDDPADPDRYRLRVPYEVRQYELTGLKQPNTGDYFTLAQLREYLLSNELQPAAPPATVAQYRPVGEIAYHQIAGGTLAQKRLVEHVRSLYWQDDLQNYLPLGQQEALGLAYETYKLALTGDLLDGLFGGRLDAVVDGGITVRSRLDDATVSGYLTGTALTTRFSPRVPVTDLKDQYWMRSGIAGFANDAPQHFYLPEQYADPFGAVTTLQFDPRDLFIERSTDGAGNVTRIAGFDFRVLAIREIADVNDNTVEATFDVLGMVAAIAAKGKGIEGDNLSGFTDAVVNPPPRSVETFCTSSTLDLSTARSWLRSASTRFVYHFGEQRNPAGNVIAWGARPAAACAIRREIHAAAPGGATSPLQVGLECSDGTGQVMMSKAQAEPAQSGGALRWIVDGKTVLNNKGNPVKQYEPYFSANFGIEPVDQVGVTPVLYYDAVGRLIRTEHPDGTVQGVEFSPWYVASYDGNDTVLEPGNAWYARNSAATAGLEERRSAALAAGHNDTPALTILDSRGREVISITHNKYLDTSGTVQSVKYLSMTRLDTEGKTLWNRDSRGNLALQYIFPPAPGNQTADPTGGFIPCYDVAGNLLYRHDMDGGDRWTLADAAGKPMFLWDRNRRQDDSGAFVDEDRLFDTRYDGLHRPTERRVSIDGGVSQLIEYFVYGETVTGAKTRNLRGQVYRHYEPSGRTEIRRLDFKGEVVEAAKQLAQDYRAPVIDWTTNPDAKLESETFVQVKEYDALSRPTRIYDWHGGSGSRMAVYQPRYNARGILAGEDLIVRATKTATGYTASPSHPLKTVIADISYNARGQKETIRYGNGTTTRYAYDSESFRLIQLRTTRPGFNPAFPSDPGSLSDSRVLQNLRYTYDPVGNITSIRDDAFEPAFFQNQQVKPVCRYSYDALYRLVEVGGRESSQLSGAPSQLESAPLGVSFPLTNKTLRNYTERYHYDAAGNLAELQHIATGNGSWTRHYQYASDSNRLTKSWQGSNTAGAVQHQHDLHGNLLNLANVSTSALMRWDYRDTLRAVNLQGGGRAYYKHDADKQRSRKVITTQTGTRRWERIYLGTLEIYRRYSGATVVEEIESHHLFEGDQRVLLVDDVLSTDSATLPTGEVYRYQYGNHLGSAALELDDQARMISHEEYHPYGTSAYHAGASGVEVPLKRYRYTGMERDEETGLCLHGARYYTPVLARWLGLDPAESAEPANGFEAFASNPIRYVDPGGMKPKDAAEALRQGYRFQSSVGVDFSGASASEMEAAIRARDAEKAALASRGDKQRAEANSAFTKAEANYLEERRWRRDFHNNVGLPVAATAAGLAVGVGAAAGLAAASPALLFYAAKIWASGLAGKALIVGGVSYGIATTPDFVRNVAKNYSECSTSGASGAASCFSFGVDTGLSVIPVIEGASQLPRVVGGLARLVTSVPAGLARIPLLTDAQLAARAEALFQATAKLVLEAQGREVTAGNIGSLRRMTAAVLQGFNEAGEVVTLAAINTGEFIELFRIAAAGGETVIEPVAFFRISEATGAPWKRPFWLHAEQVLYEAADQLGLQFSRVGSSIPGCWNCSIEALRYGIWHVNPAPID
jgi:RHS repeat-associated protein